MRNLIKVISVLFLLLTTASFAASAQNSKAERKVARAEKREARKLERAYRDSLRIVRHEEERINIGYGSVRKKDLTTSVSSLDVEEKNIGSYTSMGEYLKGRVPGLYVRNDGGTYSYQVRGVNSINSSTEPLFVVDGVVVSSIDYINPLTVKSVEVLKDASASIYGSRGGCGVIIITTKGYNE